MNIPFVDLKAQYETIRSEVDVAIREILETTCFVGGQPLAQFEMEFAAYCDSKIALGVANGTDALILALEALGIGQGDEVITPAHTFIASAAAVVRAGATPVFVDIDPVTYTLDPARIEQAITPRTKAIMPVHLYGQSADMRPIMEIAKRRGLFVVEDAAQAHGATYEGKRIGSIGDVGCFSFYPGKNLGAYGDGGAITTSDQAIADRIGRLRDHGRLTKYEHASIGVNSRLDSMQAAILRVKLRHLDKWNDQRRQAAAWYGAALKSSPVTVPAVRPGSSHVFHLYIVLAAERDRLLAGLQKAGVAAALHYPLPLHMQPAFVHLGVPKGSLPVTEDVASRLLSLPMFPELTQAQVARVVEVLAGLQGTSGQPARQLINA